MDVNQRLQGLHIQFFCVSHGLFPCVLPSALYATRYTPAAVMHWRMENLKGRVVALGVVMLFM